MKKLTLKIVFIAAFAAVAGYNVYQSQQVKKDASLNLMLEDTEALAQEEIRCLSSTGLMLYYCVPNMMTYCYCDTPRPGKGYLKSYHL